MSCMSCLYILESNPLSVVSFAIIFSHSEGCLFTLLMVSFAVKKLLNLIRSQLFTFVFISITLGGGSLQCFCLENPRDRGAWWAAVYGVAQSWTRLKRLSSSRRGVIEDLALIYVIQYSTYVFL